MIRLSNARECLLQISHKRPSVVIAAPGVLVERVAQDVSDGLRVDEEPVECIKRSGLVGLLKGGEYVDDDLSDLGHGLWLELGRKLVAELHGQSPCRLNPSLCVFRIDCLLGGRSRGLDRLAKLREAIANSSLKVGEFLLLWVPIKN